VRQRELQSRLDELLNIRALDITPVLNLNDLEDLLGLISGVVIS